MDLKQLKELIHLMVENDLSEVELKTGEETTVYLRRGGASAPALPSPPVAYAPAVAMSPAAAAPAGGGAAPGGASNGLVAIESPMVGTFYAAANPDSPPFAKPGTQISPDSVVCLIEAMKVFNEIKAEKSGVIEQVLVKNGEAVEFGQKLFLIRPS